MAKLFRIAHYYHSEKELEGTLAARFGINSIPTVLYIKDGRTVATSVGYLPKDELLEALGLK